MAVIKGKGLPTRSTKGALGDTYIDQTSGRKYKCVGATTMQTLGKADSDYQWRHMSNDAKAVVKEEPVKEVKKQEAPKEEKKSEKKAPVVKEEKIVAEEIETKTEEPVAEAPKRTNYAAAYKQAE